jgi:ornithine cyclodeaminase
VIYLGKGDIEQLLDPEDLIVELERAFVALSNGDVSAPPRIAATAGDAGTLLAMPGFVDGVLATKLVTIFPGNDEAAGHPSHQALIALFDPEHGTPIAVLDGSHITAMRTAVTSALAARLVARADARSLLVIGAGVQGRAHAEAFRTLLDLDEIVIVSRNGNAARALAESLGVQHATSVEEAVRAADIVCACTHAESPVLRREWLRPGAHVSSVGASDGRELDEATIAAGLLVVESRVAFSPYPAGARDLENVDPADAVELGEIIAGRHPGRTSPDQITVFKSVGHAIEDAVAAALVLRLAERDSRGTLIAH